MALKNTALHESRVINARPKPGLCKVGRIWTSLSDEDKRTLGSWIQFGIGYRGVHAGLNEDGHKVGLNTVELHLRGACCCSPAAADDVTWRRGEERGTEER